MATPTMHFGPEWMRPKQTNPLPRASQSSGSPGPTNGNNGVGSGSYSSLVSVAPSVQHERRDEAHPFRYSKEDILKVFKEGGRNVLGLEVERWEGVVRDVPSGPMALKELSESEKKLFASSLNSEVRRRQSFVDPLSPLATNFTDRPRLGHSSGGGGAGGPASPLRERFSRRKDSAPDQLPSAFPRKNSITGQSTSMTQRDNTATSPRIRQAGFDGVLNSSGESWMSARRRASESNKLNGQNPSIPEQSIQSSDPPDPNESFPSPSIPPQQQQQHAPNIVTTPNTSSSSRFEANGLISSQPPEVHSSLDQDLSAVEWSYIDTSGVVQGPFKAEIMQKWHDQGYFTPDLLMKRTHLDENFVPVKKLMSWCSGEKLFLSPIVPVPSPPPGLAPQDHDLNGPYQPAPIRSLRQNPLDSFGATSNPSSPASSLDARGFNGSPDPSTFGGRATGATGHGEPSLNGYSTMDPYMTRKKSLASAYDIPVSTSSHLGNLVSNTTGNVSWGTSQPTTLSGKSGLEDPAPFSASYGFSSQQPAQLYPNRSSSFHEAVDYRSTGGGYRNSLFSGSPVSPVPSASIPTSITSPTSAPPHQSPWDKVPEPPSHRRYDIFPPTHPAAHGAAATAQPIPQVSHNVAWDGASLPQTQAPEPSSWFTASSGVIDAGWGQDEIGPNSLTVDNLGQHNLENLQHQQLQMQQQQQPQSVLQEPALVLAPPPVETLIDTIASATITEEPLPIEPDPESHVEVGAAAPAIPPPSSPPQPVRKTKSKKNKESQSLNIIHHPTSPPAAAVEATPSSSSVATASKAPWGKDDEAKKPASMSLREIQNAEKKAEEERRARARQLEKERVKGQAPPSASVDEPAFSTAWGLPSSQAGGRHGHPSATKESQAQSSTTTAPVWNGTTNSIAPKKTMKEIQEEEEKRRKTSKESIALVAARRATDPQKSIAPSGPPVGGAWTIIGSGGKPAANRPVPIPSASSPSIQRANSTATSSRPATSGTSKPAPSTVSASTLLPTPDDAPVVPSNEFLKWLSEALRGLDSVTNLEEIMNMLLTFSVDPDESTIELIGDLIYSHSTTMDGRRFASEFVAKRKADVKKSLAGNSANSATKPVSIAEVVKAQQPKPTQTNEWGGFKVVKKKQKGGRA